MSELTASRDGKPIAESRHTHVLTALRPRGAGLDHHRCRLRPVAVLSFEPPNAHAFAARDRPQNWP
jgi:hypothetical protein